MSRNALQTAPGKTAGSFLRRYPPARVSFRLFSSAGKRLLF
jgi:hypothetical protein